MFSGRFYQFVATKRVTWILMESNWRLIRCAYRNVQYIPISLTWECANIQQISFPVKPFCVSKLGRIKYLFYGLQVYQLLGVALESCCLSTTGPARWPPRQLAARLSRRPVPMASCWWWQPAWTEFIAIKSANTLTDKPRCSRSGTCYWRCASYECSRSHPMSCSTGSSRSKSQCLSIAALSCSTDKPTVLRSVADNKHTVVYRAVARRIRVDACVVFVTPAPDVHYRQKM